MKKAIATPAKTKKILGKYNIHLNKRLGQNFLVDSNIIDIIVDSADIKGNETIIEIGPGIGALTEGVLKQLKTGKLIAVEKDNRFVEILEDLFSTEKLKLINEDVMELEWEEILDNNEKEQVKVIANLPYYITTPIIMGLLESEYDFDRFVFMVQKEVAERMAAKPGTKKFGALSVAVQYYTEAEVIHRVPSSVFIPSPKVDSSIICLKKYQNIPYQTINKDFFFSIVRAIFQQRRKNIKNSLSKAAKIDLDKDLVLDSLAECNIDYRIRGEKLPIEKMVELSNAILGKLNS